jgi:tetratricopeptide (TPR) repeat protein
MIGRFFSELIGRFSRSEMTQSREQAIAALQTRFEDARRAGRLEEQVLLLEKAIALGARSADLQSKLGEACLRLNRLEEARAAYLSALSFEPGYPIAPIAQFYAALAAARMNPASGPSTESSPVHPDARFVSVVICSREAAKFDAVSANYEERLAGVPHEIIGIHDARSLCEGYNRGFARSRGDVVVFSHDDIEIVSGDFAVKLFGSLAKCDIVGVAGTTLLRSPAWSRSGWPNLHGQVLHPRPDGRLLLTVYRLGQQRLVIGAQALDGLFLAARREVFEKVHFDEKTFDGWHFYDIDFTYSAFVSGFRLGVRTDLLIAHYSDGSFDKAWEDYARRFLGKHAQALADADGGIKPQLSAFEELRSKEEWVATAEQIFADAQDMSGSAAC